MDEEREDLIAGAAAKTGEAGRHRRGNEGERLDSSALFGQRSEVVILHGGEEYRLRCTSKGKLILTK